MYIVKTPMGEAEIPVVRIYKEPPTIWSTLEKIGSVASAVTAIGVLWSLWRKTR